ncbi:UDP-diphosphatase [Nibricoccus aquaticus]|uniref:Undecaprenyl-diphosphatase n=1 Tax=Nibricoccus aquaticus TaxID=2576891 RepID=A0A290QKR6_9BACT|nr:UDP-diphosphatase [Nibricoccus aquaticus]
MATPSSTSVINAGEALSLSDSIVLGLVEGITEFLPVSSTGHLIIASHALGLESEAPLQDQNGQPLWYKKPSEKNPAGIPLTIKLAADTYTVVIQAGAIAAVVLIYWAQLIGILNGLRGQNAAGLRLLRNIVLGCVPAGILGLSFNDWIDENLFSIQAVIVALISGAVLMFAAERWRHQQPGTTQSRREPADLTAKQALGIGLMQCLALWPGTSRSMVTMVGGYFSGLSPAKAAEFSFLVGLPTLTGAALYKGYKSGPAMIEVFGWPHVLVGTFVAAISAAIAVKFLVSYLTRHGLGVFAIYRLLLAATLGTLLYTGVLS